MTEDDARAEVARLNEEYLALMHAMQSAIAFGTEMDRNDGKGKVLDPSMMTPKHLRVGVNARAVDQSAIASILIAKGVMTEVEYMQALVAAARREVERYKAEFAAAGYPTISFG